MGCPPPYLLVKVICGAGADKFNPLASPELKKSPVGYLPVRTLAERRLGRDAYWRMWR